MMFPNLVQLAVCEEKYSFTPDDFKSATRSQRKNVSQFTINHLKTQSEMLSLEKFDKASVTARSEGKSIVSTYLARNIEMLQPKTNLTLDIDSELHITECICQTKTCTCGKYSTPIRAVYSQHFGIETVTKLLHIKQRKGEAEMSQLDWLMEYSTTMAEGQACASIVTSGDIDSVILHMFALSYLWPRDEKNNFKHPVYIILQKTGGLLDLYNVTAVLNILERGWQDSSIGMKTSLALSLGGNDFLPKFHGITHTKTVNTFMRCDRFRDGLFTFGHIDNKLRVAFNEDLYKDLTKSLYCPKNVDSAMFIYAEVRQMSIRPPAHKTEKTVRNPQTWMPPESAVDQLAKNVVCLIEYYLTAGYADAQMPDFLKQGCLTRLASGEIEYDLGPESHITDISQCLIFSDSHLLEKLKPQRTKRRLNDTPQKGRRKKVTNLTSTPRSSKGRPIGQAAHTTMTPTTTTHTSGFIILRYSASGCQPVVKQLPWPPDHPIKCMCFDPTVTWLLVLTNNGNIFIIPALPMLDPGSQVNQLWRIDDVTIITCCKPKSTPTYTAWWQTLDGHHIAIVATKLGKLQFVDLLKQRVVTERCVDEHIRCIELVQDDQQTITSLLITGNTGKQWKMLLEKRYALEMTQDSELSEMGFVHINGMALPMISVLTKQGEAEEDRFVPKLLQLFARSVTLSPQYAKGRHLVAAYCTKNSTYQVYDSNMEHNPLFVYRLPVGSLHTILTDRIIFMTSKLAGDQRLVVLSNQRAEISEDSDQEFNREAVLQQFDFPRDEKLISVLPKSFPFYWHEKLEEEQLKHLHDTDEMKQRTHMPSAVVIPLNSHTVMEGCIVVTNNTVYECRPRVSPERLFLELCFNQSDSKLVEQLGLSLGLDLNFLYEIAADFLLCHGNSKQATRIFHMSKGSPISRVASFSKYGYIPEILPYLQQLLKKDNCELMPDQQKQVVELGLYGLVFRLSQEPDNEDLISTFRHFLLDYAEYEDTQRVTIRLLTEAGLHTILIEFAMARGLVIEALQVLADHGQYQLPEITLHLLIKRGFGSHIAQVAGGAFLHVLDTHHLVRIFSERPQVIAQYPDLLLGNLSDLDIMHLLQLAEVLDPSRPLIRGLIQRKLHSRRRTSSLTSLAGSGEFGDNTTTVKMETKSVDASRLVYCFLMVVLHLNKKRKQNGEPVSSDFLFTNITEFLENMAETSQYSRQKLACKSCPIGSGQTHAAAVLRNGDLYTWGKSNNGRLGHGEQKGMGQSSGPCRVGTLSTLQIKVVSVACGVHHTLALTHQGLYGWGSSKYGQVGTGTTHVYTRPMLIEGLSRVMCVAIDCGQYHSLALSDDAQVYSWGWGVHGQLGHGDTEERLVPKLISAFANQSVVKVAGGYCHSLVLNNQGELYAFGCGYFGQLGLGNNIKHTLPVKVTDIPDKVITMATKYFHSIVVTVKNAAYQWGSHPHGLRHFVHSQRRARQSGKSAFEQADGHMRPQRVDTTYVNGKIKQVVCGSFHSCIITKDGYVYTWGRNLDGQLGNGTRADVPIPKMVTSINDRNIVNMTCGGEFNVAMDSEGQLYVWGRNEFCQLGLQSLDMKQISKVIKTAGSKSINQSLTELLVPAPLNLTPVSPPPGSSWQPTYRTSESDCVSLQSWTDEDLDEDIDVSINIPNLREVGTSLYGRMVVPVTIQCVPSLCDLHKLLRDVVDLKDWILAASLCIHQHQFTQALEYHLMSLSESDHTDMDEYTHTSMSVIKHYFGLVTDNREQSVTLEEDYRNIVYQILHHWEKEGLVMSVLEEFLTSTLDQTAIIIATILFRKPAVQGDVEKPVLFSPTKSFLEKFSSKFCLKLSSMVLHTISSADSNITASPAYTTLKQLGGSTLETLPSTTLEGDRLPYDSLWQDIMQNIHKGQGSRDCIYVTHMELDRLDEHFDDMDQNHGQVTPAVFFTCGHYYTKVTFVKEVARLNMESVVGGVKLPETLSVIKEYYGRKGCMPLACPRCVLGAIMMVC